MYIYLWSKYRWKRDGVPALWHLYLETEQNKFAKQTMKAYEVGEKSGKGLIPGVMPTSVLLNVAENRKMIGQLPMNK